MDPEVLKELEARVSRLLTAVKWLKDKKTRAEARLSDCEQASRRLEREKAWVRRRLGSLLGDLERFGAGPKHAP